MVSLMCKRLLIILFVALISNPCLAQPPEIPGYDVAWYDDFNGTAIDTNRWIVANTNQTTNNSLQDYLPSQVYLSSGNLVIKSENIASRGLPYRSGQVFSTSAQQYGRWDVRAKLPGTRGMWPAIWLLPDVGQNPWPSQGEIDIMENRGDEPTITSSAFHWGTNPPFVHHFVFANQQTFRNGLENYHDGFHVYSAEWDPDQIRFYVDGVHHYTVSQYAVNEFFDTQSAPMQLIINTAIGGDFLDNPDGTTVWPQYFEVDYVYVYQKQANEAGQTIENPGFDENNFSLSKWTTFGNPNANVRASTQHVRDGSGALKVFGQFNSSTNYSGLEQALTVQPGLEIIASCDRYIASNDSINGTSNRCVLKIDYYRKRNGIFGTADYISSIETTIADTNSPNNVWDNFEIRGNAPAESVEARVALVFIQPNNEGGAVHVDNLDLKRTAVNRLRLQRRQLDDDR